MKDIVRTFLIHFLTTVLRGLTPQQSHVQALAGSATSYTSATATLTITPAVEYKTAADYATGTDAVSIEKRYTILGRLYEWYKRMADEINRLDGARKVVILFGKFMTWLITAALTITRLVSQYDVKQEARHVLSAVWGAIKKKYFS